MTGTLRVGVLMGGRSAEREVSLRSGAAVLGALRRRSIDAVGIDVDASVVERLSGERVTLAFIALHGRYGEDGTIQGLLEILGIPYTGSGVLASALGMDKVISRTLFAAAGLPVPRYVLVTEPTPAPLPFAFPVVVKPNGEGSSVGISLVASAADLPAALSGVSVRPTGAHRAYIAEGSPVGFLASARWARSRSDPRPRSTITPPNTRRGCPSISSRPRCRPTSCSGRWTWGWPRFGRCGGRGTAAWTAWSTRRAHRGARGQCHGLKTSLLPDIARGVGLSFDDLVEAIVREAQGQQA
jgi:hypothetical protein